MILAAGLSPAWQQIVVVDGLCVGEVNRAREVHWCASGKVLNVGLALQALSTAFPLSERAGGGDTGQSLFKTRTLALVGGSAGEALRREFATRGVDARWVSSARPTRVCTTVLDESSRATTELVENAGAVSADELRLFCEAFREEAGAAEIVILTGSLPQGAPSTLYRDLMAHTSGRVVLDAQGALLLESLAARPFIVKPNREELGRTLGRPVESDAALHAAMRELNALGAEWVVVTQGKERVRISSADRRLSIQPPRLEAVNPIGSGDCLAAGIAIGLAAGYDPPDAVAFGVAAAAENVRHLLPARIDPRAVVKLASDLRIESVK